MTKPAADPATTPGTIEPEPKVRMLKDAAFNGATGPRTFLAGGTYRVTPEEARILVASKLAEPA